MASKFKVGQTFAVCEDGTYRYFEIKAIVRGAHGNNSHIQVKEFLQKTENPGLGFDIPQYKVMLDGETRWYFTTTITKLIKGYEEHLRQLREGEKCLAG